MSPRTTEPVVVSVWLVLLRRADVSCIVPSTSCTETVRVLPAVMAVVSKARPFVFAALVMRK
jgi:hypothetical protein